MRICDEWTGGAAAFRQFRYRSSVDVAGRPVLEVRGLEEPESAFRLVTCGHAVAQRIAELLRADSLRLEKRRA